jgi:fused signal recognition particle receptor
MLNFLRPKTPSQDGWFKRLKTGLTRTRSALASKLSALMGRREIDSSLFEELETILLSADMGVATSHRILDELRQSLKRHELKDPAALVTALKASLVNILRPCAKPLVLNAKNTKPFTLLMVGMNGAGKTTSIAKIAHYYQQQDQQIILAAGDTFRAAAIDQLSAWGRVNDVPVIAQQPGADSASVIFDAMQSAKAKQVDLLIADTAGRLHTQKNLMEELAKIKRVMAKIDPNAPHETMLVLDASVGQNALIQAREFHDAIGIDSITLTKLDGTAKGGILFAIAAELQLPIRFIGVGEQLDDLKPFEAEAFVDALFSETETDAAP